MDLRRPHQRWAQCPLFRGKSGPKTTRDGAHFDRGRGVIMGSCSFLFFSFLSKVK